MRKDLRVVGRFAALCLAWIVLPVHASISMGTDVVPYGSEPKAIEQTIVSPFSASVRAPAQALTTTVDITQRECISYTGKGPTPPNPCPVTNEETIVTTTVTQSAEPIFVEIRTGSLKNNVERIVRECGWDTTVWKLPYDFNWIGDVTITANDIQGALTKLLEGYPVQAIFYNANHVVAVVPRRNI